MSECAVMSGVIPADGVVELLRAIESQRTTGELRFSSDADGVKGAVRLDAGQPAFDQLERADGHDTVELLLGLRRGRFEVVQLLPDLPVSSGDATSRVGSLAVHAPADLMNYCERAGLTGVLTLEHDGRRARALYDRGELTGIAVDGVEAGLEVSTVFAWSEGTFRVEAHATPSGLPEVSELRESPAEAMPSIAPRWLAGERTGPQLVRVVEMRLAQILDEARSLRPPTVPPPASLSSVASRPRSLAPNPEAPVRVILLGGAGEMLLRREDLRGPAWGPEERVETTSATGAARERDGAPKTAPTMVLPEAEREAQRRARVAARADGVPRVAIVVLLALLLLGLAAFVATLVDVS